MGDAAEHAVEAGHGLDAGTNLIVGREQIFARSLIAELRFVRKDGSEFPLKLFADVNHKRGTNVVIQRSVEDFERTMRRGV